MAEAINRCGQNFALNARVHSKIASQKVGISEVPVGSEVVDHLSDKVAKVRPPPDIQARKLVRQLGGGLYQGCSIAFTGAFPENPDRKNTGLGLMVSKPTACMAGIGQDNLHFVDHKGFGGEPANSLGIRA